MTDKAFLKLEAFGPNGAGMTRRPPYPQENLVTEPPVHSSHLYVNDEERGIKIGVWECTPHSSKMQPFAVNEFMILLEGSVTMIEQDGKATTVQAGEAFVVPKGVICQWRQSEPVRKYFAILSGGPGSAPNDEGAVTKASSAPKSAMAIRDADMPFESGSIIYANKPGTYSLALLQTSTEMSRPVVSQAYRLLRIESGSLTLSDNGENETTFGSGDVVLVNPGKPIVWTVSRDLDVLSCSIKQ